MKRAIPILLVFAGLILFSSCMKFENGPCVSFRSPEKRIEGEWLLKYWTVDGVDSLEYWNNYFGDECKFSFYPYNEGSYWLSIMWGDSCCNYYYSAGLYGGIVDNYLSGVGLIEDVNSTTFPLEFLKNSFPRNSLNEWPMTRLKYKETWFEIISNNKVYELHLDNIKKF